MGCQAGDCRWPFNLPWEFVWVGMLWQHTHSITHEVKKTCEAGEKDLLHGCGLLPGCITCPGGFLITRSLPSSCFIENSNPQRASVSPKLYVQNRSSPFRWKVSCSFCCRTMITSPASIPGWNTIHVHINSYSASRDNWCTVGGDGGCRVGEVRAGTTSPMPNH